jgi:hypothetical protein
LTLDNLVGKGLQREPTDAAEIGRFLAKIDTKLSDSRSLSISIESRFDIAYEALLQIGLCALRANGYRPDSRGGHHILALQTLNTTIGYPTENIRMLDKLRKLRAAGLYDGTFAPSEVEMTALLDAARGLQTHFAQWLRNEHPELVTRDQSALRRDDE